jgi:hypothetical protein
MMASPIMLTFSEGAVESGDHHSVAFCVKRRHFLKELIFPLIRHKIIGEIENTMFDEAFS